MKSRGIKLISILLIALIFLVSCNKTKYDEESFENINSPKMTATPLEGTWRVINVKPIDSNYPRDEIVNKNIEEQPKLYIDKELVNFGERFTVVPEFRSKFINGKSYMEYRYSNIQTDNDIEDKDYEILSILDGQRFYQDIFILNNEKTKIMFPYDGVIYTLEKEKNIVDEDLILKYKSEYKINSNGEVDNVIKEDKIALVLGIKSYISDEDSYSTYLITKDETEKINVNKMNGLFLPRKQGYWKIDENIETINNDKKYIVNSSQTDYVKDSKSMTVNNKLISSTPVTLNYIDSEYVAIEKFGQDIKENKKFGIYNLDDLNEGKALTIDQIAGKKGKEKYLEDLNKVLEVPLDNIEKSSDDIKKYETNIGVHRNNGKWGFISNISYEKDSRLIQKDFDVDIIPTIDIFKNNELKVKWSKIKGIYPYTIDAVTSPGGNLLVIQNNNELNIYDLSKGLNYQDVLKSIPIKHSDSIVMTEWATDATADMWEKEFVKTKK